MKITVLLICLCFLTACGEESPTDSTVVTILPEVGTLKGDVNGDGLRDIEDVKLIALSYLTEKGDVNWNGLADINGDGIVDEEDLYIGVLNL